jgi:subtilisin-like proprotein convertase family protein
MTRTFRSRLRRCAPLLGALLLVAGGLGALDPAQAAVTTATFTNPAAIQGGTALASGTGSTPITVSATGTPTGSVYPSTISLSGADGGITSIGMYLTVTHTAPDDLDVLLVAPSGKTVVLMSDAGGYTDFSGQLSFATAANPTPVDLPDNTTFSNVWYRATNWSGNDVGGDVWPAPAPAVADPHADLGSLTGDSPNGDWKLFVHDDQDQDGGVIQWGLSVATDGVPTTARTYPSELGVSGLTGTVSDVELTLNGVSWHNLYTLDAMLVAPDGRKAMVISDVGGNTGSTIDVTLTLDDEASAPLPELEAPASGRYRPTNYGGGGDTFPAPAPDPSDAGTPLSVFDGSDPNGTWRLFIVQDEVDLPGFISAGWSLQIETSSGADGSSAADSTAPWITVTAPASHARGVRRSADIRAAASENLRSDTVTVKNVYLCRVGSSRHIAAEVGYVATSHMIVLDPSRRLRSGTRYRVVVTTNVLDVAGNRLDQDPATAGAQKKSWHFRTR